MTVVMRKVCTGLSVTVTTNTKQEYLFEQLSWTLKPIGDLTILKFLKNRQDKCLKKSVYVQDTEWTGFENPDKEVKIRVPCFDVGNCVNSCKIIIYNNRMFGFLTKAIFI